MASLLDLPSTLLAFRPGDSCRWGSPFGPHVCAPWKLRRVNVHGITLNQWGGEREQKHQCFLLVLRRISLDSRVVLLVWALSVAAVGHLDDAALYGLSLIPWLTLPGLDPRSMGSHLHIHSWHATLVSDSASFCFGGARAKNTEQNKEFGHGSKTNARVIW